VLDPRAFLRAKRDGRAHAPAEIAAFVSAYMRGEIADYQVSAWLMAAFLRGLDESETDALTRALIDSGRVFDWGPLGRAAGNALEVRESVDLLRGKGPADARELTLELAAAMLRHAGAANDTTGARELATKALDQGAAWQSFVAMVEAQGGDPGSLERAGGLPAAPVKAPVTAGRAGVVTEIDTFGLGEIVVALGGGRTAKEQEVDPRVGLVVHARLGDTVALGDILAEVHSAAEALELSARTAECFRLGDGPARSPELVLERID